ncbi:guanylate kinase [Murimonas intestini]|uniref:Guanylate kinase n=1 Tax=Murimonas intestini TaxID=1337051 RepID=A0AB73T0X6_9FIRM|nr:guanylate kinase [Murimonas intestini]MCR1840105.1 guanylate kinase [Murimonas intestini]MCR1867557.1 guanylate kinase [Murimonas intestini]MCR1885028.1 guanylate kinase [Murimonas intestini]
MGRIFYVMGKSSSGKDTIFEELINRDELGLKNIILYTTRPIRAKETDGVQYHFVDEEKLHEFERADRIIEMRAYHTVQGIWKYATVDDGQIDLERHDYLAIGTLVSYEKLQEYFGADMLVPIYIEVSDDNRLERALKRERKQANPDYEEMCRRFLADSRDFSEENIRKAQIEKRFCNDGDREICIEEAASYIKHIKGLVLL